jgi:D-alanine-D-alanine ligase
MSKTKVGIIFGGKSAEHTISLMSAAAIFKNLDTDRFSPVLIYIDRKGKWCITKNTTFDEAQLLKENYHSFVPWENRSMNKIESDILFPVLHGPNGEDGKIQGLFEMAGKPFVGANSFASALAMDKGVSKILFKQAGILVADFLCFTEKDYTKIHETVSQNLRFPLFVKPCSLGSSVGISKVKNQNNLRKAVALAFDYDQKIVIENAIDAREIEISVMGNQELKVSLPGELMPHREFYDYEDKNVDGKTRFHIPLKAEEKKIKEIQDVALRAFRALYLNGMGRVDLFMDRKNGMIYMNEINTIPGFTEISMFPKLWKLEGITFRQLVSQLIDYGFEYHQTEMKG